MVALARLASVITPQARGAAPRTLLSAVGAHSQAFLARAPAPAHAAASARAQLQAGAGVAAGRAGVAWTTLRDGVHRRPFATAAAAPFVADAAALQPPVRSLPASTRCLGSLRSPPDGPRTTCPPRACSRTCTCA